MELEFTWGQGAEIIKREEDISKFSLAFQKQYNNLVKRVALKEDEGLYLYGKELLSVPKEAYTYAAWHEKIRLFLQKKETKKTLKLRSFLSVHVPKIAGEYTQIRDWVNYAKNDNGYEKVWANPIFKYKSGDKKANKERCKKIYLLATALCRHTSFKL